MLDLGGDERVIANDPPLRDGGVIGGVKAELEPGSLPRTEKAVRRKEAKARLLAFDYREADLLDGAAVVDGSQVERPDAARHLPDRTLTHTPSASTRPWREFERSL